MAAIRTARHNPDSESPIDYVQIDGLVVLKIIKHCHEEGAGVTDVAQGVLLGLGVDNRLEITNCFPYPRHTDEEDFDEMEYQMEMMRHLRHVNVDHLHVGWYQSTHFGSFYNKPLLESQFNYQSSIEESVVLIYDPVRTNRGFLSIRAYRLSNTAMKLYKEGDFSLDMLKNINVQYSEMFEEITVIIRNSHLVNLLMCEIADIMPEQETNQFLDLGTASVLEKSLGAMMENVDSLCQETNKLTNHQRQVTKQQQAKNQYLQKRAAENNSRTAKGEPPLPEEDINKLFKPIPPPSRLDDLLVSGQIDSYCKQISQFTGQNLAKLFMLEALYPKQN
ncbi:eukaryotic translation initiation factor 3 subunit H [Caerostris extrusa]|uniref:Eukaryotic translation initiation factor 3 subunit H n=1 Tax=Caerostris extrusa TaxID=172846 RepID=A0AAV4Y878_CAEEX|nr:eukaryotic translation initiation factor 3 subunit H [Caerostris extrusa]